MEGLQCSGQFFFAGELLDYSGPPAPEGFVLPEGMEIVPWEHPRFFWLTVGGKLIAGPARREVLESFASLRFGESGGEWAVPFSGYLNGHITIFV